MRQWYTNNIAYVIEWFCKCEYNIKLICNGIVFGKIPENII